MTEVSASYIGKPNEGFGRFLVELASLLTFGTVRKVAVILDFKPADIEEVERDPDPSFMFVFFLRQKGLISEESISPLIGSLKTIGLHGVAEDVIKSFNRNKFVSHQKEDITPEHEENDLVSTTCSKHEQHLQKFFCTTCDTTICAECAFTFHKDETCDVIRLENLSQEIQARGDQLSTELRLAGELSGKVRDLLNEKRNFQMKVNENIRREICENKEALIEKIEKSARCLLTELNEKKKADEEQLISDSSKIEQACTTVENLEKFQNHKDDLFKLRKIIESRKSASTVKQELERQEIRNKTKFDLLYRKLPNDGRFGVLVQSSLIGGVMLNSKQIVSVLDERTHCNHVLLVCCDPEVPLKEFWRHPVTVNDHKSPVVMSCVEQNNNGVGHLLFAVGNAVFNVRPHWGPSCFDFVESISAVVVECVDEGSWINTIAVYNPSNALSDVFLISVSGSSLLRECHISGEILRTIEISDWVSSLKLVAYVNEHFAISGYGRYDIVLVTGDGAVKQKGSIKPPFSCFSLKPVCLIWAGATWMILWVSDGAQKQWKVLRYRQTGELERVCAEGTSCSDINVPVSVTRWKNQGFVTFLDNSFKKFSY